ncbi:MAG TPA: glycosyltransferase family 4 protein [Blastocatellia bacterium]|jgi:glycosyltransferase involved in cell wall biosynthesis|nr:glycosyltransferase family 4 protein [Blastocatellia bacterium]
MRILLINQCFHPDVVSTAQHLTDVALSLAERGHEVTVIASNRGYDDPDLRFPASENWKGVRVIRVGSLGLGKASRWRRALNFGSFMLACVFRLAFMPKFDVVLGLTSPPLISVLAALFVSLKGGRFFFWIMDLNPDEAIAAGWLRRDSSAARILSRLLTYSLNRAEKIFVLDRFMKDRVVGKGIPDQKLVVIPPWSHDSAVRYDHGGRLSFRAEHALTEKFVVMYSGNHSPCHPLDTILSAARELSSHEEIVFCFVGGGSEFNKAKAFAARHGLSNIVCLPYQPLDKLSASLSAADLHVVAMGNPFAGLVHPCKIYNILAVGKPFLYVGPQESHVSDIASRMENEGDALVARHGDTEAVADQIRDAARRNIDRNISLTSELARCYSMHALLPKMVDVLESARKDSQPCHSPASDFVS